ncbi:hypothetical protein [Pedobacter psychroterrae]|uniref:Uncharacterized protein n=1 Tax=Pedobacter psychroterrae TaxID=2530453 RepID=A0A4R0N9H4_9SPHI|nr:hypothetical protein [Pedobacter psychroterrae]TCC96848.1 hypothetical protein EZ437_20915 [Pedobacter psychroterrae]
MKVLRIVPNIQSSSLDEAKIFYGQVLSLFTIAPIKTAFEFSVPKQYQVERMNCVLIGVCKDCA